jgi:hypothetical protein
MRIARRHRFVERRPLAAEHGDCRATTRQFCGDRTADAAAAASD